MGRSGGLGGREQRAMFELIYALGASLDLHQTLSSAYDLLLPLVGADYGALAVTPVGRLDEYEWIAHNLSPSFLGSYAEMAPHDFVNNAVMARPNVVLRDADMVPRRALERNMMYERARQVGSPIEQVMAVMLHVDGDWRSGLSLYRDRRRPFSERDQLCLQQLTPIIADTVRNCRTHAAVKRRSDVLEALLGARGALIVVQPPGREIDRTAMATTLLEAWFAPGERRGGTLPAKLLDLLREAMAAHAALTRGQDAPGPWRKEGRDADLEVKIHPPLLNGNLWSIELRELAHVLPVLPPPPRKRLTAREAEVASYAALGWDDRLIADEIRCDFKTVKKHIQRIFEKYGISDRRKLMRLAMHSS